MKILSSLLLLPAAAAVVHATPSGLNNIPTADTASQGDFVFQGFSTFGSDRDADFHFGFKTGLDAGPVKLEFGTAAHLYPDDSGPWTVHGKLAVPFGENLPTLALGAANITFSDSDRDEAGDTFAYAVVSHDFGWFRLHGGCALQDGDALPFVGIDRTISIPGSGEDGGRDLFTLRADAIQMEDSNWLFSTGVLVPVCRHFVLEAWGNFPDSSEDASLTLKANFVIRF